MKLATCTLRLSITVIAVLAQVALVSADEPWSYEDWKPGGERTTIDGITFDSTIHCGGGQNFVKVADDHYRFRARVVQRKYAWRFLFKIECPQAVGRTIILEVADLNHAGRTVFHERANVYSTDGENWTPVGEQNIKIVPWTPTRHKKIDEKYGDRSHIPYGVQYRLRVIAPVMWFAGPTPYTLDRLERLLKRLTKTHPELVKVSTVGHSYHSKTHGYPIRMARITAPGNASKRENIFIMSGEHCSETPGIFACEGWMEEVLLHPDWLEQYVFYFVPIVNVDGMYYGATYYNMGPVLGKGKGVNISPNWPKLTEPEAKCIWPHLVKLRPLFFASIHNGRGRAKMDAYGPVCPGTDALLKAWRHEVGFGFNDTRPLRGLPTRAYAVLNKKGITQLAYTLEVMLLRRQKGFDMFQPSYIATGRQLARGTITALRRLGPDARKPAPIEPLGEQKPKSKPKLSNKLRFNAADFTAQLPWFYHGLPLDKWQEHDIYSFEANALELPPGDYTVALAPKGSPDKLAVGFDGRTFQDVPVRNGRAELPKVGIRNRMLSFYIKAANVDGVGPLESVLVYPSSTTFSEAKISAPLFRRYKRNIRCGEREILKKENWDEFYTILSRKGFGKKQLRAMFNRIVDWCKRRQVLDPHDIHYGAIYSEEDKYCFRDAMAAAVCFLHAWRDTGDEDYRRRALLARNYAYKGQHMSDPNDKLRYGCFAHMVHGAWGPGMQRLRPDGKLANAVGVETGIIVNLLVKTFELGLEPSAEDIKRLEAAAIWVQNNEFSPGSFAHHLGATHDCQNTNAMGAQTLMRAYYALKKLGKNPPEQWLVAARRGMRHFVKGQEAIGCWPYVFAKIGRGQAFREHNLPDQGMGFYHFIVACDSPAFRNLPGSKEAMQRAARWWLCLSHLDREGAEITIDLDDRRAGGSLKFSKFTWCRFMAAASLMRIAEITGEKDPWQSLAMRYMEHVETKLLNTTDTDKGPYKRATIDGMTLCSWIQATEWAGVLLREMEGRLFE